MKLRAPSVWILINIAMLVESGERRWIRDSFVECSNLFGGISNWLVDSACHNELRDDADSTLVI